jgi:hypothetical protein
MEGLSKDWTLGAVFRSAELFKEADVPESPLRYPQIAELAFCWRRNRSGSARTLFVGAGEKPLRAAYTRSVTGVGSGPSKARPYAVVDMVRRVANFILKFVEP